MSSHNHRVGSRNRDGQQKQRQQKAAETDTAETEAREWAQTTQASKEAQFKAIT